MVPRAEQTPGQIAATCNPAKPFRQQSTVLEHSAASHSRGRATGTVRSTANPSVRLSKLQPELIVIRMSNSLSVLNALSLETMREAFEIGSDSILAGTIGTSALPVGKRPMAKPANPTFGMSWLKRWAEALDQWRNTTATNRRVPSRSSNCLIN